ncbi:MAG TPA: S4 domain-containing protein, partial [Acidimicrobiales bacterium]|nr:S4 domain-containing protein [Acidimicrobiales bacterium]
VIAASEALFSEALASLDEPTLLMVLDGAPSTTIPRAALDGNGTEVADLLVQTGLVTSRGNARKTIEQGGAYVNNRRVQGDDAKVAATDLISDRYVVLRRGKREFHLVVFS